MKKNSVKRIISIILMLAMLVTVTTVFSGCGLFTKKVVGTEAAKILLARERLDADYVGQKTNIITFKEETPSGLSGFFSNLFGRIGPVASLVGGYKPLTADIAPGAEMKGDTVEWTEFKDASEMKVAYGQFILPIDEQVFEVAELIATIKNDVGATDVWVDTMLNKYMLIVEDDKEIIIDYYKPFGSTDISIRYTTEDARCVYEMYSFIDYDEGGSGESRTKCIPGEYYESTFVHSDGYTDYFVADRSKGFWQTNRFSFSNERGAYFSLYSVKDGIGFGTDVSVDSDFNSLYNSEDDIEVFIPDEDRDVMSIKGQNGEYTISLYMTEIASGIEKLSAPSGAVSIEDYGHVGTAYLRGGGRGDESITPTVHLSNGDVITAGGSDTDTVIFRDADIEYNLFFGTETYTANMYFDVKASSISEAYDTLVTYLAQKGVKLKTDKDIVIAAGEYCEMIRENYDIMEWSGYQINSMANLYAAEDALKADFQKYKKLFSEVESRDAIVWARDVARNVTFGDMELVSKGTATYAGGSIKVDGLTARTTDTKLLEEGGLYTLKVGLALRDGEGNISSVNTVSLHSDNEATVTYTGDGLELSQTAEYTVPTALSEGEYIVVVYFATADEGIRVTEMFPVAFFSAEEGKLDSEFMDITVKKSGDNLFIDYEIKLSDTVVATMEKDSYSYDEIKTMILHAVLMKGYPIGDEVVQTASGDPLNENEIYGEGVYRLKYLVNTSAGLVEAYMYLDLEAVHHS